MNRLLTARHMLMMLLPIQEFGASRKLGVVQARVRLNLNQALVIPQ